MPQRPRVAVIVPAYDEARWIERTLAGIPGDVERIIVVDDASGDDTVARARDAAARDPRVTVLVHRENRGVGAAIATGYDAAFRGGADIAVVMAGDAQMDPRDLPALLAPVLAGDVDYCKGDRLSWPGVAALMPRLRFVGNHVLSFLTRLATGIPVRDSQCGYTALTRAAWERMGLRTLWPRYGYPNDLLGRAAAAGVRVSDVPVRPLYAGETSGIGIRHALFVIPFVLARVVTRRTLSSLFSPSLEATDSTSNEGALQVQPLHPRAGLRAGEKRVWASEQAP